MLVQIKIKSIWTRLGESLTDSSGSLAHGVKAPTRFLTQRDFPAKPNDSEESNRDLEESNNQGDSTLIAILR